MTYPNITSEEMRQDAARTLRTWRKMKAEREQKAIQASDQVARMIYRNAAQMYESWIYGYRRALSDLGGW